jgi:hypothetical protein
MLFVEVASHREEHELYFQSIDLLRFMSANNAVGEKSFPTGRSLLSVISAKLAIAQRLVLACTVTTVRLTTV